MAQYSYERLKDDYTRLWAAMTVTKTSGANAQARKIISQKARYKKIEATTGMPWFVVGCLHMRESNANFNTWMHNGDPMRNRTGQPVRTVNVPKGRPPNPDCTFEDGAYDAIVTVEHLDLIKDWGPERCAYAMEKFNGFGYRNPSRNIPSPYLWGGTSVQKPGKFVRDGVYDAGTLDPQIGGMAVLKQLMALDNEARFTVNTLTTPAPVASLDIEPIPLSPRADDVTDADLTNPATKSKTVWGSILGYGASIGSTFMGLFAYLNNPYTLAAFVFIIAIASVALYLVLSGRLEMKKLVEHLAEDE